jgi:hypothetical protein
MFALGFALAGTQAPWDTLERVRWHALGVAVVAWAFLVGYLAVYGDRTLTPPDGLVAFQRVVFASQQWLPIVAALGFARRHLNRDSAARRYLTTAIFPVYILHQTVIVVIAHALQPARLDTIAEGSLLVLATAALCFLGYEAIRRVRPLRPLFGLAWTSPGESPVPGAPLMSRSAG